MRPYFMTGGNRMWNVSKEAKERFEKCNLLPIHESDDEWEIVIREAKEEGGDLAASLREELEEVKGELLDILPSRFIPYVEDGSLNQPTLPKAVRADYLQWMQEADKEFEDMLDAASENTQQAITYLSNSVQAVMEESLHDAVIERIEQVGETIHLYLNTDGGFSTKSLIHLEFEGVKNEVSDVSIQVEQWLIYYELQKRSEGFAFRALFDSPQAEWTIKMENMEADYYYRPKEYRHLREGEQLEDITLLEYIAMLNQDHSYWFITPHIECNITSLSEGIEIEDGKIEINNGQVVVTFGGKQYTYDNEAVKGYIYTDIDEEIQHRYEEPLPFDEIEAAALGSDIERQVQAWNTMYANSEALQDVINRVLSKVKMTDENEMIIEVYVNHFYNEGILKEAVAALYQDLIDN